MFVDRCSVFKFGIGEQLTLIGAMALSDETRQYTTIGCALCLLMSCILFLGTKSFERQPSYALLICVAHFWPFLWSTSHGIIHDLDRSSPTWRYLSHFMVVGLMGAFSWLAVTMPRHFVEAVGPWILGLTFIGVFLGQISVSVVEDDGIGELFHGVCMGSVYETGAVTNGWILYFLCTLVCTKKIILARLSGKRFQDLSLDCLDVFERRLVEMHQQMIVARESRDLVKLEDVENELESFIGCMREAKTGRQQSLGGE